MCKLTAREGPLYWAEDAAALYTQQLGHTPDYIARLEQGGRKLFPGQKFQDEVLLPNITQNKKIQYNAFEMDIAILDIYFGKDTLPG